MNKTVVAIIAVIAIAVIGVGAWLLTSKTPTTDSQNSNSNSSSESTTQQSETSNSAEVQSGEVTVRMKDSAFTPQSITVKKGTKVTWVNDDTIRHNVVATNADNTGGLPTENPLLGKDGSYSFTFNQVGVFEYECTPHRTFMTGTVEVVE